MPSDPWPGIHAAHCDAAFSYSAPKVAGRESRKSSPLRYLTRCSRVVGSVYFVIRRGVYGAALLARKRSGRRRSPRDAWLALGARANMETPESGSLPFVSNELSRRKMLLLGSGALAAIAVSAWAVPSISGVPVARAWTNGTPCPDGGREESESTKADGTSTTANEDETGGKSSSSTLNEVGGSSNTASAGSSASSRDDSNSSTSGKCGTSSDASSGGKDSTGDGSSKEGEDDRTEPSSD